MSNVPAGNYLLRHFGGGAGIAKWQVSSTFLISPHSRANGNLSIDNNQHQEQPIPRSPCIHCYILETKTMKECEYRSVLLLLPSGSKLCKSTIANVRIYVTSEPVLVTTRESLINLECSNATLLILTMRMIPENQGLASQQT